MYMYSVHTVTTGSTQLWCLTSFSSSQLLAGTPSSLPPSLETEQAIAPTMYGKIMASLPPVTEGIGYH